eukprot:CAMPEP_0115010928 /NCGR_PEP_ID=MMETSP0216-20121206/23644_1 /TAXON_ID=223996 /ORGANISM="Protocruzia adherens, Strain Boccale" /LENGTH=328 /DNA_ID=CAMNT_0002379309 /DNA_START=73 /DNA_END=1059 /DNA_ORIENTATION=-
MDWPGLLKWSLQYQDGTTESNLAAMSEEDRKWITNAMEKYTFDDVEQMKIIGQVLRVPDDPSNPDDLSRKEDSLETLSVIVDNLDAAKNFHKVGGFVPLMDAMVESQYESVRRSSADIFALCCQNNTYCQVVAEQHGILGKILDVWGSQSIKIQEMYAAGVSSLVRGLNLKSKVTLVKEYHGVLFIKQCLSNPHSSLKLKKKLSFLLLDLLYYDIKYEVRKELSCAQWVSLLIDSIADPTKTDWDHKTFTLKILRSIARFSMKEILPFKAHLASLKDQIQSESAANAEDAEMYQEHFSLLKSVVFPSKERDDIFVPSNDEQKLVLSSM